MVAVAGWVPAIDDQTGSKAGFRASWAVLSRYTAPERKTLAEGELDGMFPDQFTAQYNGLLEAIEQAKRLQGNDALKPSPYPINDTLT